MVFIHGGGFVDGSATSDIYGPEKLLIKDIILVTLHYRLGFLGFASLDDKDFAGNYGLKDQSLALKWVKNNIAKFGGDANKITLVGESAGAASAHYQVLSKHSQVDDSTTELLECLRKVDATEFLKHNKKFQTLYSDIYFLNGTKETIKRHRGDKYLYKFGYEGSFSISQLISGDPTSKNGACHADDLLYLFPMKPFVAKRVGNETDKDKEISARDVDLELT
ncbi:hypothetical protein LSTR_LSTR008574 [Laodelphax striatellus]|uniref:Carboxylic ester hydrolase n=1 Tax=Laodelphax striatellus TaxID=195883 RepID=A0A482WW26_LAOST|nr:hypothetical protein LSTR_LSTR008574 [Laodelphax striatellus]